MPASKQKKPNKNKTKTVTRAGYLKPLKLVHHRHSFRLVHWHNTNYPMLGFIVLLTGLFCIGWTSFARGDTSGTGAYVVTAVVPADTLTVPATISYPTDGQNFNDQIFTATGDCPANSYVKLYRNDVYSGTDLCQSNGHWYVQTSLVPGSNKLQVLDFNVTNQAGPASAAVTVTYTPPVVSSGTGGNSSTGSNTDSSGSNPKAAPSSGAAAGPPLVVTGDFSYQGVYAGQPLSEKINLSGGHGPYALSIDWGDGSSDLSSHQDGGEYNLSHIYDQPGGYENSYTVKITATDANGQTSVLQIIAIVTAHQTGSGASGLRLPGSGITPGGDKGSSPYSFFWRVAAPAYGAIFVSLSSFWLGERRELEYLRRRAIAQHRRRPHHV